MPRNDHTSRPWYVILSLVLLGCNASHPPHELRVCSDPNNLPFSNRAGEGLENHLAQLVAKELRAGVKYTWWPQRRGFIRNTLAADSCDVGMGMTLGRSGCSPPARTTARAMCSSPAKIVISTSQSFDDPALKKLKIGVQLVGDDYNNTPPVHALSRRGIVAESGGVRASMAITPRPILPPGLLMPSLSGDVDLAVAWGPLAGYFARRSDARLDIVPVSPADDPPGLRFAFDISLAVRPATRS